MGGEGLVQELLPYKERMIVRDKVIKIHCTTHLCAGDCVCEVLFTSHTKLGCKIVKF